MTEQLEPTVVPSRMITAAGTESLLRHALRRGCHVRVGIGDNPGAFPTQANAELLRWVVGLARDEGLVPAAAQDVCDRFCGQAVVPS